MLFHHVPEPSSSGRSRFSGRLMHSRRGGGVQNLDARGALDGFGVSRVAKSQVSLTVAPRVSCIS